MVAIISQYEVKPKRERLPSISLAGKLRVAVK